MLKPVYRDATKAMWKEIRPQEDSNLIDKVAEVNPGIIPFIQIAFEAGRRWQQEHPAADTTFPGYEAAERGPGYHVLFREDASIHQTALNSLAALAGLVPDDVLDSHRTAVTAALESAYRTLNSIRRGYPCSTAEAMQRVAGDALPAPYKT